MSTVGDRIKKLRTDMGVSQVDFAERIGVTKQTLYKYENNIITNIPSDKIEAIASTASVSPAVVMGWNTQTAKDSPVLIPVLGRVSAGIPLEAIEEIIDYEEITETMAKDGEYFGLKIKGDSMEPKISNGDIVIVRKQNDADDGDYVVAIVDQNEGCCKRLKKYEDGTIALVSTNPAYSPMYFTRKDKVKIIGKVKELRAKF